MRAWLVASLCVLLSPALAFGWNKPGHMVTGAIAYDLLKAQHPKTLAKVLDVLRQHPQYADVIGSGLRRCRWRTATATCS